VDEQCAAADAPQEDAVDAVVQETDVVEGHGAVEEEDERSYRLLRALPAIPHGLYQPGVSIVESLPNG
jgi:hypothetical protein